MAAVGTVHWVADEELLHAVTAVSGSGPAYVFHLIEALAAAGVRAGRTGGAGDGIGARHRGGRRRASPAVGRGAAQLRANVTSPGGTTAAALQVLGGPDGLGDLLARAVAAAALAIREVA